MFLIVEESERTVSFSKPVFISWNMSSNKMLTYAVIVYLFPIDVHAGDKLSSV